MLFVDYLQTLKIKKSFYLFVRVSRVSLFWWFGTNALRIGVKGSIKLMPFFASFSDSSSSIANVFAMFFSHIIKRESPCVGTVDEISVILAKTCLCAHFLAMNAFETPIATTCKRANAKSRSVVDVISHPQQVSTRPIQSNKFLVEFVGIFQRNAHVT